MQKIPVLSLQFILGSTLFCSSLYSAQLSASSNTSNELAAVKASQAVSCKADANWFNNPALPTEVKKSAPDGSSNFCDFYQFSW